MVVMGIMAILGGLLLNAVQRVREASDRVVCGNNLKQIGLAINHFYSIYKHLPPSRNQILPWDPHQQSQGDSVGGVTWAVLILPYLDETDLYRAWDINKPYYQQSAVAREASLPYYFCPARRSYQDGLSVSGDSPWFGTSMGANVPGALGDYAACVGTTGQDCELDVGCYVKVPPPDGSFRLGYFPMGNDMSGVFVLNRQQGVTFPEIKDGQSYTLLVGEKHVPVGTFGYGAADNSLYNGDYYASSTRAAGPAWPLAQTRTEQRWCFGSYHTAVCQFVFVDGHVEMISNTIDPVVLGWLASRNDNHTIPPY
jgi:prepilin-type processing-associated H-X9-DG protein